MNYFPQSVQWVFSHIFPSFLYTYAWLALHCCYDEWVKIKAILNCLFIRSCCFEPQKHFGCQSYYCEVVHQNQSVWSCHHQSAIMTLLFRFSSTLPTYTYTLGSIVCWLLPSIQYGKSIGTVFYQYFYRKKITTFSLNLFYSLYSLHSPQFRNTLNGYCCWFHYHIFERYRIWG